MLGIGIALIVIALIMMAFMLALLFRLRAITRRQRAAGSTPGGGGDRRALIDCCVSVPRRSWVASHIGCKIRAHT